MKCKVCGGTGTSNTCVNGTFKPCTFCDGTGEYEPFDLDVELDKLYPTEQTNEEWLKSLDTEGLVDYLYEVHKGGNSVERQRWIENHKERVKMQFRAWLKQPHT